MSTKISAVTDPNTGASFLAQIAAELKLAPRNVAATAQLLAEGATVPFIARYRKEVTGTLDEVAITNIRDRLAQLVELEARRGAIVKSLEERNLATPELLKDIAAAATLTALEDAFAPYRPKRRTRATMAKERGLEPLADWLLEQQAAPVDPASEAAKYVVVRDDKDLAVPTPADALAGARDILAERFTDEPEARRQARALFEKEAVITSKVITGDEAKPEAAKFRDYFAWSEPLAHVPSHRLLAMRRGEAEGPLLLRITVDEDKAVGLLKALFVKGGGLAAQQVALACEDGYQRLLAPAMETDARLASKKAADAGAIRVFVENMRELLLAAPLGQKKVLAIDPGFRTGCKLAVLDAQGKLLLDDVIYPTSGSDAQLRQAVDKVTKLVAHFGIEAIAIGNGTAGRETEAFVQACGLPKTVVVLMVNESGASIYSASDVAREEFPDKDITVRGAVSIGRRVMDPLAELVKIDPKSIGVGQYQHDVDQGQLKHALDDVVVSCVNRVGVEVNTASKQLLSYVSGLNAAIADNIVTWRNNNGPFKSRAELKKVPRLGEKTFEQAAGFLRIRGATHPLDASAVHPESYPVVLAIARDLSCTVADLTRDATLRAQIKPEAYVSATVGLPTLQDIVAELAKPGRDPRQQFEVFKFADGVSKMTDLKAGMKLPGIVTNVTAFGAFVDIGVHQDGLVHISQLSDTFVKDPGDVVKVGQRVQATVLEVDLDRKRIALSMKAKPELGPRPPPGHARPQPRDARGSPPRGGGGGGFNSNPFNDAFGKLG
jgi:uncharacterized protein